MQADRAPNARHAALRERIEAARQRLAENRKPDWAEIDNMLEEFSRDLEALEGPDPARRAAIYDRISGHLDDIHARLDTARPTD